MRLLKNDDDCLSLAFRLVKHYHSGNLERERSNGYDVREESEKEAFAKFS